MPPPSTPRRSAPRLRLVADAIDASQPAPSATPPDADTGPLDAYSRIVTTVAERLLRQVVLLRVGRASDLQRLMVGETIGRPLPIRILRIGEVRDLTIVPVELKP